MPQATRLDAAHKAASERLDQILQTGRHRILARQLCHDLLDWVFGRQPERPDESTFAARRRQFAHSSVIDATNVGLDHAYGDRQWPQAVLQGLDQLSRA